MRPAFQAIVESVKTYRMLLKGSEGMLSKAGLGKYKIKLPVKSVAPTNTVRRAAMRSTV